MALSHTHCLFQNPMLWHHDPILSTFWTPARSSLASSEVCWCSDLWKHFNNLSSILALHKCALQDWFCLLNLLTDFTFYNEIFSDRRNRFSLPAINWSYCVKFDPIQHHSTLITSCFWMTPFIPFIFCWWYKYVEILWNIKKYVETWRNMYSSINMYNYPIISEIWTILFIYIYLIDSKDMVQYPSIIANGIPRSYLDDLPRLR